MPARAPDQIDDVTYRAATREDRNAIFSFIERSYGEIARWRVPERWDWEFARNPAWLSAGPLPVFLALDPRRNIVGQSCVMAVPFTLFGEVKLGGWGCDLFVGPEWRGRRIATDFFFNDTAATEIHLSLNMAGETRRIKDHLGDIELASIPVYELTARYSSSDVRKALQRYAAGVLPTAALAPIASLLAHAATVRARWRRPRGETGAGLTIEAVPTFGPDYDTFWDRVSPAFDAAVCRTTSYLAWKYQRQPHMQHEIIEARREGELCGYAVLRSSRPPERQVGKIVELVALPEDTLTLSVLIASAVDHLVAEGMPKVQVATTVPGYAAALERAGFRRVDEMPCIIGSRTPVTAIGDAAAGRRLLSLGDGDWDQFPSPF